MSTPTMERGLSELSVKAHRLYAQLSEKIETPENIGKLIVMEVESGDYEIDEMGIETLHRLQARHPNTKLYAIRIGYKSAEVLGGILERTA